jgi:hypothetical protein
MEMASSTIIDLGSFFDDEIFVPASMAVLKDYNSLGMVIQILL